MPNDFVMYLHVLRSIIILNSHLNIYSHKKTLICCLIFYNILLGFCGLTNMITIYNSFREIVYIRIYYK